jgi:hypothetical protein
MKKITVFDTSTVTDNIGDFIIMDAVYRELLDLFPNDYFINMPTHDTLGSVARRHARQSDASFVGGTNLLCPNWFLRNQWRIGLLDFWRIGHPILLGVGWQKYKYITDIFTAWMLQYLLKNKYMHSVRDAYTQMRLNKAGVKNVINTGCVSMWRLDAAHCKTVATHKTDSVIVTVTHYLRQPELDKAWIDLVCAKYKNVYFWSQMYGDEAYFASLCQQPYKVIGANLSAYDTFLKENEVDFVGTRLHGGIRALHHKRRTIILEVDNRAKEIANDTNLPTCARDELNKLTDMIEGSFITDIRLPVSNIEKWKSQFKS